MSVPGSVNHDEEEAKGHEGGSRPGTPTGIVTPDMVEKGVGLELKLAGLEDEEEEIQHRPKKAVKPEDYLSKKTPEQVFKEFDTDGSGLIDYDEFQNMVTALGFNISAAKALKYFRHIDEDGSGEIDMDEFRVALFMLDPVTGNTLGFQPSKLLTPSDAFEMFDEDRSGAIDEDEFFFALEYLGLKVSDSKQEKYFNKYDADGSGTIDYEEFKNIWLATGNIRQELINRGIEVTKWMSKWYMRRRLREIVEEEELAERKTLKLAKQWASWRKEQMEKEADLKAAVTRAEAELATALDVGGQVYMFGRGVAGQFAAKPVRPDMFGFDRIKEMWRKRLSLDPAGNPITKAAPDDSPQPVARHGHGSDSDDSSDSSSDGGSTRRSSYASSMTSSSSSSSFRIPRVDERRRASIISQHSASSAVSRVSSKSSASRHTKASNTHPALVGSKVDDQAEEEEIDEADEWAVAKFNLNPYEGLTLAYNTAPLWGRRIMHVDFGQSTAFALSDMGEMFVWGGKSRWWTEFQPNSKWAKKKQKPGKLTERSDWQMTMGIPEDVQIPTQKEETFQGDGPQVVPRSKKAIRKAKRRERRKRMKEARKKRVELMAALAEERESGSSDESLSSVGSLASDLDDNEEIRKAKLRGIKKLKRKKRRARKARERAEAEHKKAEEDAKKTQLEKLSKPVESGYLAGPDGENLYEIDPYELDEEQETKLKAQLRARKQAREDNKTSDMLKMVTQYYGVWEPAPTAGQRLAFLQNVLMPKITFEQLQTSLRLRGKILGAHTKAELTAMLGSCLRTELTNLEEDVVKQVREAERSIEAYMVRNQPRKAKKLKEFMLETWEPLLLFQQDEEDKAKEEAARQVLVHEERFEDAFVKEKINRAACLHERRKYFTPRGNHPYMTIGGITYRGPRLRTFRGGAAVRSFGAGAHHVVAVHHDGEVYSWGVGDAGRLGFGDGETGAEGGMGGRGFPTLIKSLRGVRMMEAACGYAHTVAVSITGHLFAWGSAMHGQVGLGPVDSRFDLFCPRPTMLPTKRGVLFKKVACGPTYSTAITQDGHLYVWGNADSGKLGIGPVRGDVYEPTLVKSLADARVRVAKVACGNSHAALCTEIFDVYTGGEHNKLHTFEGGHVYVCGSSQALGIHHRHWARVPELSDVRIRDIAAGFSHTVVCSNEGELYSWGANIDGCLGLPPRLAFVSKPRLVRAMYVRPKNIANNPHSVVTQSSIYNGLGPELAIDGDFSGDGEWSCIHTQRQKQPWWQLDLGQNASIEKIVIWNRNDMPFDRSQPKDAITKKLFPSWLAVSQHEFRSDLGMNLSRCIFKRRLKENMRRTVVTLPQATVGRFILIQLEGENYLHFAQMEVYGTYGDYYKVGRVSHVAATHGATVVSMGPVVDEADVRNAYKKAVRADSNNAVILRQLPMYYKYFDEFGRGEQFSGSCPCCTVETRCEMCTLEQKWHIKELPKGPGGRLRRLDSIEKELLGVAPPELEWDEIDTTKAITVREMINKKVKAAAAAVRRFKKAKARRTWAKVKAVVGIRVPETNESEVGPAEDQVVQSFNSRGRGMLVQTKKVFRPPALPDMDEDSKMAPALPSGSSSQRQRDDTSRPSSAGSAKTARSTASRFSRGASVVSSGLRSMFGKKERKERVSRKEQRRRKEKAWAEAIPADAPKQPVLPRTRQTGLTPRNRRPSRSTVGSRSSFQSGTSYATSRTGAVATGEGRQASVRGSTHRSARGSARGSTRGSARSSARRRPPDTLPPDNSERVMSVNL